MNRVSIQAFAALVAGTLFGFGLALSGMTEPTRVLGFLDVFGHWDPTLAFVMGGALLVSLPGFQWLRGRGGPVLGGALQWPSRRDIDARLVVGALLFGIGWGLAGFCPGPALVGLVSGLGPVLAFVAAMVAGFLLHDRLLARRPG